LIPDWEQQQQQQDDDVAINDDDDDCDKAIRATKPYIINEAVGRAHIDYAPQIVSLDNILMVPAAAA
jgi:hypothetical protein